MIGPLKTVPISFQINGRKVSIEVSAGETALHAIRERLHLTGAKEGNRGPVSSRVLPDPLCFISLVFSPRTAVHRFI